MFDELYNALVSLKGVTVEKRGSGDSDFLFIKSNRRAVEASLDGDLLWVEFWDSADEESDDPPVRDKHFASLEDAIREIKEWL